MEQDPPPLLLQTPEQWLFWPDLDATFSSYHLAVSDLHPNALQHHEAVMSQPYPLQPPHDLTVADVPPSNALAPDADLNLGFGWCMDLATNDMNILLSPEPLCFPVLDDAALTRLESNNRNCTNGTRGGTLPTPLFKHPNLCHLSRRQSADEPLHSLPHKPKAMGAIPSQPA
ncbi:hypothetical protein LY76DRAFT_620834 [Colletotrichum caudatum]|nr:hypothetical protein LY76DRAFT_620834 [Colletotrichum caudatum]